METEAIVDETANMVAFGAVCTKSFKAGKLRKQQSLGFLEYLTTICSYD